MTPSGSQVYNSLKVGMTRLLCLILIPVSAAWAGPLTLCVQTTSNCNIAEMQTIEGNPYSDSGTFGPAGTQEMFNVSGSASPGILHAFGLSSISISGAPVVEYVLDSILFVDTVAISDPALNGTTGYLQMGYALDATISSPV